MTKVQHAIIKWSISSGLEFFQVPAGQGDIQFGVFDMDLLSPDSAGFAYYPGGLDDDHPINSDIFLDYDAAADPYVLLHEIGHAIGLKHPFEGDIVLAADLDNVASTVMSYDVDGYFDGPLGTLDQQAVQFLYGDGRTDWEHISGWGWDQQPGILRQSGTDAANLLIGVSVTDFIRGEGGHDTIYGRTGDDTLDGGRGDDDLRGGDGSDILYGQKGLDRLDGGYGDDWLDGGSEDDFGDGGAGNDSILGSAGLDLIYGGDGNDLLDGGDDNDELYGQAGDDELTGSQGNDYLRGGAGSDHFRGGSGADKLYGESGADRFIYSAADESPLANPDIIFGFETGIDKIDLTALDTASVSWTDGPESHITLVVGDSTMKVVVKGVLSQDDFYMPGAAPLVVGTVDDDTLEGTGARDEVRGLEGADWLNGLAGDDVIDGGAGADAMSGGAGNDEFIVDDPGDIVVEHPGAGTDIVKSTISFLLPEFVENLVLRGSDEISGTGNALGNVINGNDSANLIAGGDGRDFLFGGGGSDTLQGARYGDELNGGAGADLMQGGQGNDRYFVDHSGDRVEEGGDADGLDVVTSTIDYVLGAHLESLVLEGSGAIRGIGNGLSNRIDGSDAPNILNGKAGADLMHGGGGSDTYYVQDAGDRVAESYEEGVDSVKSSVTFTLAANIENLTLTGTAAFDAFGNDLANTLTGNRASNILNGRGGADVMKGGGGSDTYFVNHAGDQAIESSVTGGGADTVNSSVSFKLGAFLENLTLTGADAIDGTGNGGSNVIAGNGVANLLKGGKGADLLKGGGGGDRLEGNSGNDVLQGGGGDDELVGSKGGDTLTGGSGRDRFVFDQAFVSDNVDTILDFDRGSDKIVLENAVFKGLAAGALAPGALHIGKAAADPGDRIIYNPATGALLYDSDGAGGAAAIRFAWLDTQPATLAASDFLVI